MARVRGGYGIDLEEGIAGRGELFTGREGPRQGQVAPQVRVVSERRAGAELDELRFGEGQGFRRDDRHVDGDQGRGAVVVGDLDCIRARMLRTHRRHHHGIRLHVRPRLRRQRPRELLAFPLRHHDQLLARAQPIRRTQHRRLRIFVHLDPNRIVLDRTLPQVSLHHVRPCIVQADGRRHHALPLVGKPVGARPLVQAVLDGAHFERHLIAHARADGAVECLVLEGAVVAEIAVARAAGGAAVHDAEVKVVGGIGQTRSRQLRHEPRGFHLGEHPFPSGPRHRLKIRGRDDRCIAVEREVPFAPRGHEHVQPDELRGRPDEHDLRRPRAVDAREHRPADFAAESGEVPQIGRGGSGEVGRVVRKGVGMGFAGVDLGHHHAVHRHLRGILGRQHVHPIRTVQVPLDGNVLLPHHVHGHQLIAHQVAAPAKRRPIRRIVVNRDRNGPIGQDDRARRMRPGRRPHRPSRIGRPRERQEHFVRHPREVAALQVLRRGDAHGRVGLRRDHIEARWRVRVAVVQEGLERNEKRRPLRIRPLQRKDVGVAAAGRIHLVVGADLRARHDAQPFVMNPVKRLVFNHFQPRGQIEREGIVRGDGQNLFRKRPRPRRHAHRHRRRLIERRKPQQHRIVPVAVRHLRRHKPKRIVHLGPTPRTQQQPQQQRSDKTHLYFE